MSRRTPSVRSEGIDGIGHCGGTNGRLEAVAIHNVDRPVEQARDVLLEVDIFEDRDPRIRIDFNHDFDIIVRSMITPGQRAEEGSMLHTASTQGVFGASQRFKDFRAVHGSNIAPQIPDREGRYGRSIAPSPAGRWRI